LKGWARLLNRKQSSGGNIMATLRHAGRKQPKPATFRPHNHGQGKRPNTDGWYRGSETQRDYRSKQRVVQ